MLEGARHEPTIIVAARGGRVDKIGGRRLDRQPGLNGARLSRRVRKEKADSTALLIAVACIMHLIGSADHCRADGMRARMGLWVLLRALLGAQVGVGFGAPAAWSALARHQGGRPTINCIRATPAARQSDPFSEEIRGSIPGVFGPVPAEGWCGESRGVEPLRGRAYP